MSSGWWANKVQQIQGGQAPQAPQSYAQPVQQYQQPQQRYAPQAAPQQAQVPTKYGEAQQMLAQDKFALFKIVNAVGSRGAKGVQAEPNSCPECGSFQYFERRSQAKMGAAPAPYCDTCGYNGMYVQHGSQDTTPSLQE